MKEKLQKKLEKVAEKLLKEAGLNAEKMPDFSLTEPKEEFGEYSTNLALVLSKILKKKPQEVAKEIIDELTADFSGKIEMAGPGHINFFLSYKYFSDLVNKIITENNNFGETQEGKNISINNEFISANPTGPMHLGNGRGGFLGDTLSRVLKKNGYAVTNEYYVNDGGGQVMKLGHSVLKDDLAEYQGEYIDELHEKLKAEIDVRLVGEKSAEYILAHYIQPTVEKVMGIHFDVWAS